ncbi:jerky protein [Trichonephila inaurata madagascariensis]|uniref:Jerky protein n=1 Tax=Trichonephila inaurata madagascariensis TaxID=2747483 RepID=A0A8X7BUS7_9ARAC|nr:jerky protein [Trichonephila inaurata madagascariensis]
MFNCGSDLFDIESNECIFKETCEKLKCHPFESPWKICFPSPETETLLSKVEEFDFPELLELNNTVTECTKTVSNCLPSQTIPSNLGAVHIEEDISSEEFKIKLSVLKESLTSIQKMSFSKHVEGVELLSMISLSQIPELCTVLRNSFLNEMAMTLFIDAILNFERPLSLSIASALVKYFIYPEVFESKQSSRNLLATALNFSVTYPKPIIDEVILPCLNNAALEALQLETLLKMVKSSIPNEYISYCIKNILELATPIDNVFSLLQNLIERKIHHGQSLLEDLTRKMESWSSICKKSVKFIKLLISILLVYGSELDQQQITVYHDVIKINETVTKRAAENVIKKLKIQP